MKNIKKRDTRQFKRRRKRNNSESIKERDPIQCKHSYIGIVIV
jgi:hypothetical protein